MYYETIFIVNPDVSQENTEKLVDSLKDKIGKVSGARVVKQEYWGVRPLAYSIAKRKRGHYILLVTDGDAKALAVLEQALRLEERVLRYMTTRLEELSDQPSPIIRRREAATQQAAEADAAKLETAEAPAQEPAKEEAAAAGDPASSETSEASAKEEAAEAAPEAEAEEAAAKPEESAKTKGEEAAA